jgi:prevent-host-death family protein
MFFRFWVTGWLTVGLLFSGPTLAAEIVRNLGEEREPLIITQNGEAKVVMQDIESYEQTQETMALLKILAQGVSNFYRLYLPLETQRYLFRILSAKLILTQPERFGFHLQKRDYYPPLRFSTVELTCDEETSLTVVAKAAQTDFKRIKDLNPELRGHYLAAGTYTLAIPENTPPGFQKRFNQGHQEWSQQRQERIYIVQPGDNLSIIAKRFGVPLAAILIWNRIDLNRPLHPGDRLIIYPVDSPTNSP